MSKYLLMIAIGPVQDFIVQARRTRDLWHGSHLLSELSRRVAKTLAENGATLIFPALDKEDKELEYSPSPWRDKTKEPVLNISNIIIATVPEKPKELAADVRDELFRFWKHDIAEPVKNKCSGLLAESIDKVWDEQIDSLLEILAAWTEIDNGDYKAAREKLTRALAGRKNLRDFEQWEHGRSGAPKSSLDGGRDSLLAKPSKRSKQLERKYRINEGEQLDAVGLVKRAGGKPDQFVPLTNIALASWIEEAAENEAEMLNDVREACKAIDHFPGKNVGRVVRPGLPVAKNFEYDASVFLPSRWQPVLEKELKLKLNMTPEGWGNAHVRGLLVEMSQPFPYVACLVADGDYMGKAISVLKTEEDNQKFSRKLAEFATAARKIVEQDHSGSLVYAGGDDVLAFLPLPEALACADDLRQKFSEIMKEALPDRADPLTLSAGLGVGHVLTGMGDLLELGRTAEKLAKGSDLDDTTKRRNALAIIIDKRSGGQRQWRGQWSEWDKDPGQRLTQDAALYGDLLSTRKVYQIADVLARLPKPDPAPPGDGWSQVLFFETKRLLQRAGETGLSFEDAGLELDMNGEYKVQHKLLGNWIDRMLIARIFANAVPQAKKKTPTEEVAA